MSKTKQYYKVVDRYGDRYFSTFAAGTLRTEYKLNEWSEASVGGLLVFDTLQAAVDFKDGRTYYDIFKCDVDEPVEVPQYRADGRVIFQEVDIITAFWCNVSYDVLEDALWKLNIFESVSEAINQWPEHTVAFKRVKLTELIEPPYDLSNND